MTADDDTHREPVNPTGAHGTSDVQILVTLLRRCGGTTTVGRLRELSNYPQPRLRAALEKLEDAGRIDVHTGLRNVRVDLREGDDPDPPVVADGSGLIDDHQLSISPSAVFELLANARRRALIKQLSALTPTGEESETHLELQELAEMTAVSTNGGRPGELSRDERHRTYVSLTQVHAESLDEYGVAEYHQRVKKLTPTPDIHSLAAIIEAVDAAATARGGADGD